jgi:phytoene dehydrogenase-like protein
MADNKLIIIGSGIAGLATGCYARMNGYDVEVFEMHNRPGGVCTSWNRRDFTFDYCIHNLSGSAPGSDLRKVWEELGALEGAEIIDHDIFVRIEGPGGERLDWHSRLDPLEAHLKEIAPEDSEVIDILVRAARKFIGADFFALPLGGFKRMLRGFLRMPAANRWSNIKMGDFSRRFQNSFLRRAFLHLMYDIPGEEVPMLALLLFMAGLDGGDLGWPWGGSLAFSRRIEKRLLDLGGTVNYKTRVEKVLVEKDRAIGVRLADGTERTADRVISAADGHSTIFGMLEGRFLSGTIRRYYEEVGDIGPFGLIIFLGLKADLSEEPHALTLLFDGPIDLGEVRQDSLHLLTFGSETGLVPEGKSVLKIEAQASYPYWKRRRDSDLEAYRAEKERIARAVIERLTPRFPILKDRIEVMDVSTPPTVERFTGNLCGWQPGPPKEGGAQIMRQGLSKTLPGLDRFHMVGHWASASVGVSTVALMGRSLIKKLCKQDGKRFVAS